MVSLFSQLLQGLWRRWLRALGHSSCHLRCCT